MSFSEVRQALVRDFVFCVDRENLPPLGGYLAEYVKSGCTVVPGDYRLVPLTASTLRYVNTSSDCLTDCMLELQSKYQQFVPDDWGGHMEKGTRDLGVIGFNVLEGVMLDILEINPTTVHLDWARPRLDALDWERLLIRAVVEFGRVCQARQIRLLPADRCPIGIQEATDAASLAELKAGLKQRYDASAQASGFTYDQGLGRFMLDLAANECVVKA